LDLSAFEIVAILAIGFQSFLLFLALFEPTLRYKVSRPPSASVDSAEFDRILATLADSSLHKNTKIEVLTNGEEFYHAELAAIRQAKRSVNLEAYIFRKGVVTRQLLEALTERARAGVKVNLVLDAVGSFATWKSYFKELREAGGRVEWYHGFKWHQLPRLNSRTHREIIVIDCTTAFIGGAGFADQWLISKPKRPRWRDTVCRIEGDAVASIQATFIENFLEATGELMTEDEYFCFEEKPSNSVTLVIDSSLTSGQSTRARMLFQTLLASAKEQIDITTPYFLPDKGLRNEMIRAVERGVKMTVICPGHHNDHLLTRRASRRLYGKLLQAGAEIHEYQAAMIHAKILVVDNRWSVFGSTNFDHRSFTINDEVNVASNDKELAARFRQDFVRDLAACKQITYNKWKRRPLIERFSEGLGRLLERQQ
jgi:cardiolipin synthase